MNRNRLIRSVSMVATLAAAPLWASAGHAAGPLENPDNGAAAFARGGAWLATATDPIAAHYNPAALATIETGISLDLTMNFNRVCFDRRNPGNVHTGPGHTTRGPDGEPLGTDPNGNPLTAPAGVRYLPACNNKRGFPNTIPAISAAFRVSKRLGLGLSIVPPATYGVGTNEWPALTEGRRLSDGEERMVPAPYRYLTLGNQSALVMPTLSFGYEVFENFRVGAGFIWGLGVISVDSGSMGRVDGTDLGDNARESGQSRLETRDLFIPGFVASMHWSVSRNIDVSLWYRWMDAVRTADGDLTAMAQVYDQRSNPDRLRPLCPIGQENECSTDQLIQNYFQGGLERFEFLPIPPELRAGIRFHQPREGAAGVIPGTGLPSRDPLRDDVFDIELNASYTWNSAADVITVRFPGPGADGMGELKTLPTGVGVPPNADRPTGYKDSVGLRLGGQYNVIANKLGLRAGTWIETAAVDPEFLNVSPVPGQRGGFGGGIVVRQDGFDFSFGYQRHWNAGLDNRGEGAIRATAGTRDGGFLNDPPEQQFRSFHAINGGRVIQSAHVFQFGAAARW